MQRRLMEDLREKDAQKKAAENVKFKARPAPANVKDVNLWGKISEYEKNRREQALQEKIQLQDDYFYKPFEFLLREANKPRKVKEEQPEYKYVANPVPP
jgi:hypothetical protein